MANRDVTPIPKPNLQIVAYDQEFARRQIIENLHPSSSSLLLNQFNEELQPSAPMEVDH